MAENTQNNKEFHGLEKTKEKQNTKERKVRVVSSPTWGLKEERLQAPLESMIGAWHNQNSGWGPEHAVSILHYCPIHNNYRPEIYHFGVILGNSLPILVPK